MVQRIRNVSGNQPANNEEVPSLSDGLRPYRGFGSVRGETLDQFHDRMFEIDPLEAMAYEMEVALEQSDRHPPHPTE